MVNRRQSQTLDQDECNQQSADSTSLMYKQTTCRGVGAILFIANIVDPMLDIGSLLIVAYIRKTGKMFTAITSMIASKRTPAWSHNRYVNAGKSLSKA